MDYYPYGEIRLDEKVGTFSEQRKFAGHEYDADTSLSYMNARYYNGKMGRFVSQDPMVLKNPEKVLEDPQSLNYYAYSRNNPLRYIDPTGESWQEAWQGWLGFSNSIVTNATFGIGRVNSNNDYFQTGQTIGDATSIVIGAAETAAGIITAAGGAAGVIVLSPTGVGAVGSAGVSAMGVGVAAHGFGNAMSGLSNLMRALGSSRTSPNRQLAEKIANGHAYDKHVLGNNNPYGREYGSLIQNRGQFAEYIESVINNPSDKYVSGDRALYWDDRLGSIVIDNPKNPTTFRPQEGKAYFDIEVGKMKGGGK